MSGRISWLLIKSFVMVALLASESLVARASEPATGLKSHWKIEVYQGPEAKAEMRVGTVNYISARNSKGEQMQLSENSLNFGPKMGFDGLHLKGRLSVFLEELTTSSARVELDVWDTSGLPEASPFFKSIFTTSHRLQLGETQDVTFSQGDASVLGGAARYLLKLTLEKVEVCGDESSCRE